MILTFPFKRQGPLQHGRSADVSGVSTAGDPPFNTHIFIIYPRDLL